MIQWLQGEVPLLETGGPVAFRPLASIVILEATHLIIDGRPCTKGKCRVVEAFKPVTASI
ncbi:MAG: hypothetical protein DRO99_03435 [Candidatus Aenigmatarchaeota archaeon]|nr:MAG: hypothetical protein DRO99_03435 [Candidatus Aenigmarchaeota archaeon]